MKEHDLYADLVQKIDSAFNKHFKEKKMENNQSQTSFNPTQNSDNSPKYLTIEEYSKATGKRFRMTKEQMQRNLSREEAFAEFIKTLK